MGSGTDANVFITLNGDKQRIVRRPLEKPDSGRNPFERNSKDDFKFEDTDVGQVSPVTLNSSIYLLLFFLVENHRSPT